MNTIRTWWHRSLIAAIYVAVVAALIWLAVQINRPGAGKGTHRSWTMPVLLP